MDINTVLDIIFEAFGESLEVCIFVMLMMSIIEALNIESHGRIFNRIRSSKVGRVGLGALIGAIPGCMGGYVVTSLYNHGLLSFGALAAMMIAASGDEAFVMLASFPKTAIPLILCLSLLAFGVGLAVDALKIKPRYRSHQCGDIDVEPDIDGQHCKHHKGLKAFLKENIWKHVIKKHLPRVFAWTFGVLVVIGVLANFVDVRQWIDSNVFLMIVLAALVGLIPESGPHLLFVTLFASGTLPLPVLIASCISQDGHASLPLLAENKVSFLLGKAVGLVVAVAVGSLAMLFC